jgi:signal transduction histidine kinase
MISGNTRSLSWWVTKGSMAMAAIAGVALALTVASARMALAEAGTIVARSEDRAWVAEGLAGLQAGAGRTTLVAAVAAAGLVGFALAWTRAVARLSITQVQGQRQSRLVALGRASSVITHELRNPLAALKGHAQLLLEDLSGPARENAARVVQGAERLEHLTTVLLDFVRDGPLEVRATTARELLDRALTEPSSRRVRVDVSGAPATLQLDVERMALALRNLVENGLDASEADAHPVEVRIAAASNDLLIEVRDHGSGLSSEIERQLFEPFVTTKARGTGLGLYIARRIAELHRGQLTGRTHEGGGAVFCMTLPQARRLA